MSGIAITGEGIVCAIGLDKSSVLSSLRHHISGIGTMRYLNSIHTDLPVGEVKMSTAEMRKRLKITSPYIGRTPLMAIMAIQQALAEAGLTREYIRDNNLKVMLISGTTVGGMDITEQHFLNIINNGKDAECLNYHECGDSTKVVADYFKLFSDYTTISTACSSSANSLITGARLLQQDMADIVVAGGSEALSKFHFDGFNSLMILDHQTCRPFDATHNGLNLGEGAAFVVMENAHTARMRKKTPHAYLTGYGNACDAFHQTSTSKDGLGAFLAMQEALKEAGLTTNDIHYINAHGTGTPNNDQTESAAIRHLFQTHIPPVSSTKSFTGHTTSASGSIEAVISIMALNNQFIPSNPGFKKKDKLCITPSAGKDNATLSNVMCNAFGFGGNDSSLIFSLKPTGTNKASFPKIHNAIRQLSKVEVTDEAQLNELKEYIRPLEARRMGKLMKATLLSSLKALKQAGIACPDAIISCTARGCLENSEKFLLQLLNNGEEMLSPTLFMQSTHNTMGSMVAIKLNCHGYNITYSQGEKSPDWALKDARLLLCEKKVRNVLVEYHEESTELFRKCQRLRGLSEDDFTIKSISIVLSCGNY